MGHDVDVAVFELDGFYFLCGDGFSEPADDVGLGTFRVYFQIIDVVDIVVGHVLVAGADPALDGGGAAVRVGHMGGVFVGGVVGEHFDDAVAVEQAEIIELGVGDSGGENVESRWYYFEGVDL